MRMSTRFFPTLLFLSAAFCAAAQSNYKPPSTNLGILYKRETAVNLKATTNRGYAPGIEFGRLRTYYRTTYYHFSIGEIKHAKELRQSPNPTVSRSFRSFIYGKQNNLLALRAGWGVKRYFSEKAKQKGVAVGISYSFGPTLALLKPYYLALRRPGSNPGESRVSHERYSDENAAIFLDNTRILGASPFTRGLAEVKPLPGANASLALHLDWGAFDEVVKALEIGCMVDVFASKAKILSDSESNKQAFFNFFVNLQLGKRR